jgi:arginase family enzyme
MARQLNVTELAEQALDCHGSHEGAIGAITRLLDSGRHTTLDIDVLIEVRERLQEWAASQMP